MIDEREANDIRAAIAFVTAGQKVFDDLTTRTMMELCQSIHETLENVRKHQARIDKSKDEAFKKRNQESTIIYNAAAMYLNTEILKRLAGVQEEPPLPASSNKRGCPGK